MAVQCKLNQCPFINCFYINVHEKVCRCGLPPTAEIDHYIPLGCGLWKHIPLEPNSKRNLQALCPNCHAKKTMKERLITPRGSYLPCSCGRTHSTYFKPSCTYWTKKMKRIQDGVRRVRRKSKRTIES